MTLKIKRRSKSKFTQHIICKSNNPMRYYMQMGNSLTESHITATCFVPATAYLLFKLFWHNTLTGLLVKQRCLGNFSQSDNFSSSCSGHHSNKQFTALIRQWMILSFVFFTEATQHKAEIAEEYQDADSLLKGYIFSRHNMYNYYVFGHYPSSCLYLKNCRLFFKTQRFSDWTLSPKRCVLKNKQDGFLDKDRTMDNVQKHNNCTNVPSSQTFRSYRHNMMIFNFTFALTWKFQNIMIQSLQIDMWWMQEIICWSNKTSLEIMYTEKYEVSGKIVMI
jgi:hypothetical protein